MIVAPTFNFDFHGHKGFFEIDYVLEGQLTEIINNREYSCPPGTLLFIRENDEHRLRGADLKLANILFSRKLIETSEFAMRLAAQKDVPYVIIPQKARLGFESILNELFMKQNTPEGELLSNRFFYDVMVEWFIPQEKGNLAAVPEWLRRGIAAIEAADVSAWSVNRMVKSCCKSREHVARTFQAVFGCSISRYINRMRLEKARKQLVYSNMSISDICFGCGYNNMNYFYRLFKKHFSMTPADYRKKYSHIGWGNIVKSMCLDGK